MVSVNWILNLFLRIIDGLKKLSVFQNKFRLAFCLPSTFKSSSNFSTKSPSMPSVNSGGQNQ